MFVNYKKSVKHYPSYIYNLKALVGVLDEHSSCYDIQINSGFLKGELDE